MAILMVHMWVGLLVVISALTLVWRLPGRRVTLYIITLQILLGLAVLKAGYPLSQAHLGLGIGAWILYMAANAVSRRATKPTIPLVLSGVATLMVIAAFGIGQSMAHGHMVP